MTASIILGLFVLFVLEVGTACSSPFGFLDACSRAVHGEVTLARWTHGGGSNTDYTTPREKFLWVL